MLLDIHTHHVSPVAGESIRNVGVSAFSPAKGYFYSVGIHPWTITDKWEEEWEKLAETVRHPAVLAIGEAGLDKLSSTGFVLQKQVFERQVLLSEEVEKPLVIHCVKSFNELVELKKKYRPRLPWVVHGFRNNLHIARQLMHEGIYLSVGEKYQTEVLQAIPIDRVLTETDESRMDIREIVAGVAAQRGVKAADLLLQIDENARNVFFKR